MDDGWTLPRPRRNSAGSLPPYSSAVTSQPTSTRGKVIRMQSFSVPSSARGGSGMPPPAPPAPSSAEDGSRMPPPPPPAPSSAEDGSRMPPPKASTKVTSSGQGVRVTSSVADYSLPLPTLAMKSERPSVGAMSIATELALARKSSLRGSRESLSTR